MSEVGGLKRSFWGLTAAHASQLAKTQEQESAQVQEEAEAAHRSLVLEIERLRQRVEILRQSTDILTQRLVRTRSSTGAAVRMVEQQLNRLEHEHAAAIGDLKFESVRASAELQVERQAFRDFLAELHRLLSGRGILPADLLPQLPTLPLPDRLDWQPLLTGKVVNRTVTTTAGRVVALAGDRVSPETIDDAEENGLLPDLLLAVRLP